MEIAVSAHQYIKYRERGPTGLARTPRLALGKGFSVETQVKVRRRRGQLPTFLTPPRVEPLGCVTKVKAKASARDHLRQGGYQTKTLGELLSVEIQASPDFRARRSPNGR
jgi:hypothetical protein